MKKKTANKSSYPSTQQYSSITSHSNKFRLAAIALLITIFAPFSSTFGQFQLNGNTIDVGGDCYRLTDTFNWQLSSIFSTNEIDLDQSFDLQMEMLFGVKDGADGMSFVLQSQGNTALGVGGGGMGYETISPSVIVEFDTYQNNSPSEGLLNDPPDDHVAVLTNGSSTHVVGEYTTVANIEDIQYHDVRITWNATTNNLIVLLDCVEVINYTNDIVASIFGGDPDVYWGFTASTGGQNNRHEVCILYTNFFDQFELEDKTICSGESVLIGLEDEDSFTYSWSPITGLDDPTISNPTASPNLNTIYTLTITNNCGATVTDEMLVTVSPEPTIPLGNQALKCPTDASVTLDATITDGTYIWSNNATTPSIDVTAAEIYTVTVTNLNNCSGTATIEVIAPNISIDLGLNQVLCVGDDITLDPTPVGTVAPTFVWSDNSTNPTLLVNAEATYTVTVTDQGCSLTDEITILYNPLPVVNITGDTSPCVGETVTLDAVPTGGTAPTYIWQDGSTNPTFDATATGTYTVTVTDLNCSQTDQITITYNDLPIVDLGADQTLCDGENTTLSGVPSNAVSPTYEWQDASTNPTFDVTVAGTYTVTVTDQGCTATDEITINYNPNPTVNLGPDFTQCGTIPFTLNAPPSDSYLWQDGSTNAAYNVTFPGGTYTVTVTTNNCSASDEITIGYTPLPTIDLGPDVEICEGETYTITAPAADSYIWQDASTNPTFDVTQTGNYSVAITTNNCTSTDAIFVTVNPLPVVDLGEDITLCEGQTTTLTAPTADSYEWQDGSTNSTFEVLAAGTYAVTVTTNNCSSSDEIEVSFNDNPTIDLGEDITLCEGQSAILTAPISDTYLWQDGSTDATFEVTGAGIYSVTATTDNCSGVGTIEVFYNPLPTIDLGEDLTICESETTTLTAPTADSYLWQDGSTNATFEVTEAGTYSVAITIDNCSSSDEIAVDFNPLPNISLGEDLTLCENESTILDATPSNAGDFGTITYEWQDGSTNPTFNVSTGGTFAVTVTADGCTSMDEVVINFDTLPSIDLGADQTLCEGETLELDATLTGATYEWQDGSTNPTFTVSEAGEYSVTVTLNSCILEGSISIDYQALPLVDLGEDQTICEGETTTLDATTAGATYQWQDGSTDPTFEVSASGVYEVMVTANGCTAMDEINVTVTELPVVDLGQDLTLCEGQSTTLDATPSNTASFSNISYEWQDGSTDATFEVNAAGTFSVIVTADDCVSSDEITVNVDAAGTIGLGNDLELCEGEAFTLDATTDGATYEWQDGSTNPTFEVTAAGIYSVTVNTGGCLLTGSIEATYSPNPTVDLGEDVSICGGEGVTLDATTAGATYEWQDGSTNPTFDVTVAGTYSVIVTVNNCSATDEIEVAIATPPAIDLGADVDICEGENATLTAPTADSYIWSTNETTSSIDVNQSGVYTVTITENGCTNTDEIEVTVNPRPTVSFGGDVTLCEGETLTLDATFAGATYQWQDASTNPTFEVTVAGTYSVTVTANGCSNSDEIVVDFGNSGTIDLGEDVTLCEGETLTLDATTSNATYQWQDASTNPTFEVTVAGSYSVTITVAGCVFLGSIEVDYSPQPTVDLGEDLEFCEGENAVLDANFAGATYEWQDGSTNPTFNVTQSGNYSVTVSVDNCSATDEVLATVNALPVVDLGVDVAICEGETTTLTAPLSDAYIWSTNETSASIEVNQSGIYTVTATNGNCSGTDEIEVIVNPIPTVGLGPDVTLCTGETRTLDATFAGATYQWQDGSTNPTFEVAAAGTYAVTVTANACSSSDEIVVNFDNAPTVDLGEDVTLCEGETLTLDATTPNATYEWQDASTNPTFEVTVAGSYSVTVTIAGGCVLLGSIEVDYAPQPTVDLGEDLEFCEGENAVLDATFAGATYEWQDASTNPTFNVTQSGTYLVTVSVGNCSATDEVLAVVNAAPVVNLGADVSVCEGENVTLSAPLADTYFWSTNETTADIEVNLSGIYTVTATNGDCAATDEIEVVVNPVPIVDLGEDVTLCEGETLTLDATTPNATYEWQDASTNPTFEVSQAGIYSVTATIAGECTLTGSIEVMYSPQPEVDLGGTIVLCGGLSVTLNATQADGSTTYEWQDGSTNPTFELNESGVYAVTVTIGECSVSDEVDVTLEDSPTIDLGAVDTVLCAGQTLLLSPPLADTYLWQDGSTEATFEVTEVGVYSVETVLDDCLLTGSIEVRYAVLPTVDLGEDLTICENESIVLEATTTDAFSYLWLENGATTPTLEVSQSGVYTLQVFSENTSCAMASDNVEVVIEVCQEPKALGLAIPNAFSPDGDGVNDFWRVTTNLPVTSFECQIYNRWGKMVFSSADVNGRWNGMVGTELQDMGVYAYYVLVRYQDENGSDKEVLERGNVTLVW
ncbi:MAG: lectin-like domain-containing protein [Chitinophagales bacterium]